MEEYQILATLDGVTCALCGSLDGVRLSRGEFEEGTTAPPFHLWCRCTTAPWFEGDEDGERLARNAEGEWETIPAGMSYSEWRDRYVEKTMQSSKIPGKCPEKYKDNFEDYSKLTITDEERKILNELYEASKKDGLEHGVIIVNGERFDTFENYSNKVRVPPEAEEAMINAPNNSVHMMHSHTNDTLPSAKDIQYLLNEKVFRISVITNDLNVFSIKRKNDGYLQDYDDEFFNGLIKDVNETCLNIPEYAEWTGAEKHYIFIREQAYRIAREFKWDFEGGKA